MGLSFSRWLLWRPSNNSKQKDLSNFLSTSHLDDSYQVSIGLLVQEKAKNRFSRWVPWWPSWISDWNELFLIYKSPQCFLPSFESIGLSVQEKKRKIDFQDGGHLGFPIGTILAISDLQVTPMLPTKFRVDWPFGSGVEVKNRFSRWLPWQPSWISDRNNFSYF